MDGISDDDDVDATSRLQGVKDSAGKDVHEVPKAEPHSMLCLYGCFEMLTPTVHPGGALDNFMVDVSECSGIISSARPGLSA